MKVADIKSAELFIKTDLVEYEKEFNAIYTNCANTYFLGPVGCEVAAPRYAGQVFLAHELYTITPIISIANTKNVFFLIVLCFFNCYLIIIMFFIRTKTTDMYFYCVVYWFSYFCISS